MKILLRLIINAVALLLVANLVPGFHVDTFYHALIAAVVIGILNASLGSILFALTLPVNIITLGLFSFVINAFILWLVSTFIKGFEVAGFWPAVLAAIILWAVSVITNMLIKTDKVK